MTAQIFGSVSVRVEVAFSSVYGPNTISLNGLLSDLIWTDVTEFVRSASTSRGRSSELDSFQTGSASIILSNVDRRFDPLHSAGPYFGSLTPLRPVRITTLQTVGATTTEYPAFFGYVDGWPQSYELVGDATVSLTISDAFKVLNSLTLTSYYATRIASDTPAVWLRFNDGTSQAIANIGSNGELYRWKQIVNNLEKTRENSSVAGLIVGDSNQGGDFTNDCYATGPSELYDGALGPFGRTIEFWIQTSSNDVNSYGLLGVSQADTAIYAWMASAYGIGIISAVIGDGFTSGTFKNYVSNVVVNDGKPHHVTIVTGASPALYVDGIQADAPLVSAASPVVVDSTTNRIGGTPYYNSSFNSTAQFVGTVDEYAEYLTAFSAAQVADHYAAGLALYAAGERTDQRVQRILDLILWPADGSALGRGISTVQGIDTEGRTALAALKECEDAERGLFFADALGGLRFVTRNDTSALYGSSVATFGDGSGETGYVDIVIEYNDRDIANTIKVSRRNGAIAAVSDSASQGSYFPRSYEISDLITETESFSNDLASALLIQYKDPKVRVNSIGVSLRSLSVAEATGVLSLVIGQLVTVKRRPQGVGAAISEILQVQSLKLDYSADDVTLAFDLAPRPLQGFVLDSAINGVLDVSRLAF